MGPPGGTVFPRARACGQYSLIQEDHTEESTMAEEREYGLDENKLIKLRAMYTTSKEEG